MSYYVYVLRVSWKYSEMENIPLYCDVSETWNIFLARAFSLFSSIHIKFFNSGLNFVGSCWWQLWREFVYNPIVTLRQSQSYFYYGILGKRSLVSMWAYVATSKTNRSIDHDVLQSMFYFNVMAKHFLLCMCIFNGCCI